MSEKTKNKVVEIQKFKNLKNIRTKMKIQLQKQEPTENSSSEELSKVLIARFGLNPRKKDGEAKMHKLMLELYERKKISNRDKKPESAVMPVEEMALHSGIKRQTMYEYLHRWIDLNLLKKTSFVSDGKVVIGYELNGNNLEGAFRKAEQAIKNHLEDSFKIIEQIQDEIKKEKLRTSSAKESSLQPNSPLPEEP